MLLYIHGFNSSNRSDKAVSALNFAKQHFPEALLVIPQVPSCPEQAMSELEGIILENKDKKMALMGSSLGGYYATYLAQKYQLKAALINPAVKPYELLEDYLGPQVNPYTDEHYTVEKKHLHSLKALDTPVITQPNQFLLLQQSGDEVLDYRQAVWKYQCCEMIVESGGDHSFIGFERHLSKIFDFLQIK